MASAQPLRQAQADKGGGAYASIRAVKRAGASQAASSQAGLSSGIKPIERASPSQSRSPTALSLIPIQLAEISD